MSHKGPPPPPPPPKPKAKGALLPLPDEMPAVIAPPPPPPPGKGPAGKTPPPPPPGKGPAGKAPPPPQGAVAITPSLFTLTVGERVNWMMDSQGLNLKALKMKAIYPDAALLSKVKLPISLAGKAIPNIENERKEKCLTQLRIETEQLLRELFQLPTDLAKPYLDDIDKKFKNWKRGDAGLNDAYEYLIKAAINWRQESQSRRIETLSRL